MSDFAISAAITGILGLIVGSFIAAVSVRLPRDEDVVMGRSRCMSCKTTLASWHLVPVISWLMLRGRCGVCRAPISRRYPVIELAAALVGIWAAVHTQGIVMIAMTAILGWQLLSIAIIDGENLWLPDILTWPLAITGLVGGVVIMPSVPWPSIIGIVVGFGSLWSLAWFYRRLRGRDGLGGGDPYLFGAAGAWVGWTGLPSVLLWACTAGLAVVLSMLIVRRRVDATDRLPFGVFLAVGIWMTWLYGPIGVG